MTEVTKAVRSIDFPPAALKCNKLPLQRQLNLRDRPIRTTFIGPNSRANYRVAAAGQLVGYEPETPCTHCEGAFGIFYECIVVPGSHGGSCINCLYGSKQIRCSFRK
jgi:hypothetical protein